jgi:hypothetical protein
MRLSYGYVTLTSMHTNDFDLKILLLIYGKFILIYVDKTSRNIFLKIMFIYYALNVTH